jgi:nitroreductase
LKVSPNDVNVDAVLDAIALAPTSFGLQPFTVRVVKSEEVKQKLQPVSFGQAQVVEATYLLVFCAKNDAKGVTEKYISANSLDVYNKQYADMIRHAIGSKSKDEMLAWAKANTFIALGVAITVAANLKIDACPMEGFEADKVKKILALPEHEFPVAYLALGKAAEEAKSKPYPKSYYPKHDIIIKE